MMVASSRCRDFENHFISAPHPGLFPGRGGEGEAFTWFVWFAVEIKSGLRFRRPVFAGCHRCFLQFDFTAGDVSSCGRTPNPFSFAAGAGKPFRLFYFTKMISQTALKKLAAKHGTPLFVVDHAELRANYAMFKKYLPRVQAYYAVKANSDPAIVRTLYQAGASF